MRFNENEYVSPGQMDFVPRERRSQIWKIIAAFSFTIAVIFVLSFSPNTLGGRGMSAFFSMGMVALLCFYIVYHKQQNLDLVMSTEYQNMLFAEAVALGSSFCLFVRRDGTIVYANSGLRQVFPNFIYNDAQMLEGLFEQGGVSKTDRERVMDAIYSSSNERLVFPVHYPQGTKEYVLTLEPLARPAGYTVVRGREFRGQRAGMQLMPDVLRTTSVEKLDHLLSASPIGMYATDSFGRLEYVNPALEAMLGYHPGEMLEARIAIQRLLNQLDHQPVPDDYTLAEHRGEALLITKQGNLLAVQFQQSIIRDAEGKLGGATGSILPSGA